MNKIHHIVFHDDIDGIFSAAIYLHDHVKDNVYRLYPVSSTSRGEKFEVMIRSMGLKNGTDFLVILDYENHERCDFWVDHHWSKTMGEHPVINSKIFYNPTSPSAARLLYENVNESNGLKLLYDLLNMVDIIDNANYKSVNQIFHDTHPLMILRSYIERSFPSDMMFCRIVEMLSTTHFNLKRALYQLRITDMTVYELRKDVEKAKKAITIAQDISIIRQSRPGKYPRYAEFYIDPKIKYSVRLSTIPQNKIYFQIGYNKWHSEPNEIDIGKMLSSMSYLLKGGGHYSVGGGIASQENTERLLDDLYKNLNKEEALMEDMEKVGVDKECDPIESKAESMVKTGEANNIAEARKKASESEAKEKEEKDDNKD